jgi:ketosteroid isomerase-like protein
MSEENLEAAREGFDAVNRRDVDALLENADPGIVQDWSRAIGPQQGIYRGHDEVRTFLRSWWEAFDESVVVVDELIDAGDRIVGVFHGHQRGRGSGVVVQGPGAVVVLGFRDGALTAITLYQSRADALAAVGLSE